MLSPWSGRAALSAIKIPGEDDGEAAIALDVGNGAVVHGLRGCAINGCPRSDGGGRPGIGTFLHGRGHGTR